MVEFMMRVVKVIRDPDFDGYDLEDFYNAMIDSVKAGESAFISAINDAWDEMSPATPPPGTPPLPPPYVAGLPYGCVSGYSTYTISWPAVNNADDYNVYASAGFGYDYLGSAPQTFGYFWTSVNSDVRVSASNTYGESGLSPVGFSASHSLCF